MRDEICIGEGRGEKGGRGGKTNRRRGDGRGPVAVTTLPPNRNKLLCCTDFQVDARNHGTLRQIEFDFFLIALMNGNSVTTVTDGLTYTTTCLVWKILQVERRGAWPDLHPFAFQNQHEFNFWTGSVLRANCQPRSRAQSRQSRRDRLNSSLRPKQKFRSSIQSAVTPLISDVNSFRHKRTPEPSTHRKIS